MEAYGTFCKPRVHSLGQLISPAGVSVWFYEEKEKAKETAHSPAQSPGCGRPGNGSNCGSDQTEVAEKLQTPAGGAQLSARPKGRAGERCRRGDADFQHAHGRCRDRCVRPGSCAEYDVFRARCSLRD